MKKFKIKTLGCKVNQFESDTISQGLKGEKLVHASGDENTDLYIINTCTVTQKAAMQSRQAVRQAKRKNPNARIVVTGCYAQTEPDEIRKISGVDAIIGHKAENYLTKIIKSGCQTKEVPQKSVKTMDESIHPGFQPSGNRTRPFLKIQDGCSAFCTYCIVPHARGPSRSVPVKNVLEDIETIGKGGFHEVVLTGIHLGAYGADFNPSMDLLQLLKRIQKKGQIDRLRLSSIEPKELTDDLIRFTAEAQTGSGRICRHFHIPLQSGDNKILKRMGRPYSRSFIFNLVSRIHQQLSDAAIGLDTLIGFPGETDEAFENTVALIQDLPISYLHVFPFSPRKGTPAYSFKDKVPTDIIKSRCSKMRELGHVKKKGFYTQFIGKEVNVLVEGKRDRTTRLLKGVTSNYIPVLIKGNDDIMNQFVAVKIGRIDKNNNVFGSF